MVHQQSHQHVFIVCFLSLALACSDSDGSDSAGGNGGQAGSTAFGGNGQGQAGQPAGSGGQSGGAAGSSGGAAGNNSSIGGNAGAPADHPDADCTLDLTDLADRQVVQRSPGMNEGSVPVAASVTSQHVATVQARVRRHENDDEVVNWIDVHSIDDDGEFQASVTVPQGGWYRMDLRGITARGTEICSTSGSNKWGVGMNILVIGQSNMVGSGAVTTDLTPVQSDLASLYSNDDEWKILEDPYDGGGNVLQVDYDLWHGGSMMPTFVNSLHETYPALPIGIVASAKGGTALVGNTAEHWGNRPDSDHADPRTLYGNALTNARTVGGVELIIMHQGETDATNGVSAEDYRQGLQQLLAWFREDLGHDLPLFIGQLARAQSTDRNRTDVTMSAIRAGQATADDPPNIYLSALCIDFELLAGDHYVKDGYDTMGLRMANAVKAHFGDAPHHRGPHVTAAQFGNTRAIVDVTIEHRGGDDFTPATGITGFEALDDGTPVTVDEAERTNATTIQLTLASPIAGSGQIRYLYGKSPDVTGIVKDNTNVGLPLEPTVSAVSIAAE